MVVTELDADNAMIRGTYSLDILESVILLSKDTQVDSRFCVSGNLVMEKIHRNFTGAPLNGGFTHFPDSLYGQGRPQREKKRPQSVCTSRDNAEKGLTESEGEKTVMMGAE